MVARRGRGFMSFAAQTVEMLLGHTRKRRSTRKLPGDSLWSYPSPLTAFLSLPPAVVDQLPKKSTSSLYRQRRPLSQMMWSLFLYFHFICSLLSNSLSLCLISLHTASAQQPFHVSHERLVVVVQPRKYSCLCGADKKQNRCGH